MLDQAAEAAGEQRAAGRLEQHGIVVPDAMSSGVHAVPSQRASRLTVGQTCSWSSAGMVSDVQGWVSSPSGDHGWLIKSDLETSAKSFLGW